MAEPTQKSPEVDSLLNFIAGLNRKSTIRSNKCMTCGGVATAFKDAFSFKEYRISGMCQGCQDNFFTGE